MAIPHKSAPYVKLREEVEMPALIAATHTDAGGVGGRRARRRRQRAQA